MKVIPTTLPGVVIVEPIVFPDARGFFFESYHGRRYAAAGLPERFVQDNHSCSTRGTVRGLHYQLRHAQGKLIRALRGTAFDVAVDIRRGSPTFGRWFGVELSAENKQQLYIPPGFAHGFCAVSDVVEIEYKCTDYYVAEDQHGLPWNDPGLRIQWPVTDPLLSEKDRGYKPLSHTRDDLPRYEDAPPRP